MAYIGFLNSVPFALKSAGYEDIFLKVKQINVLESLYLGRDTIAVLPTGYGKSVIFHLLPLIFDYQHRQEGKRSIVLVVIPLNALVEDQIKTLKSRGIEASILTPVNRHDIDDDCGSDSSIDEDETEVETNERLPKGNYQIIFA